MGFERLWRASRHARNRPQGEAQLQVADALPSPEPAADCVRCLWICALSWSRRFGYAHDGLFLGSPTLCDGSIWKIVLRILRQQSWTSENCYSSVLTRWAQ